MQHLEIPKEQYSSKTLYSNKTDDLISLKLLFFDYPPYLINSIRRIILSDIPNVSFDDKKKDSIQIIKNTSQAHNEFIKHRLSLVPLTKKNLFNITKNPIITKWDGVKRVNVFQEPDTVPTYSLEEHYTDTDGNIKTIYVSDFINHDEIMKADLYTGDYSILMKLKSNPSLEEGEILKIKAKPVIGTGNEKSYYSTVGTVVYSFIKENREVLEDAFLKYLEMNNKERQQKNIALIELDTPEYDDLHKAFSLLESQKIYKKNDEGEACNIELLIESINSEDPLQIFYDALSILTIKLTDIFKFIKFNEMGLVNVNYFRLEDALTLTNQYELTILNENHSFGNLVTKYLSKMTLNDIVLSTFSSNDYENSEKIFDMVSYKMPHPLTKSIAIRFLLNSKLKSDISYIYGNIQGSSKLNKDFNFPQSISDSKMKEKNLCIVAFIKCVNIIVNSLDNLKEQFIQEQVQRYTETNLKNVVLKESFLIENCNFIKDFSSYDVQEKMESIDMKVEVIGEDILQVSKEEIKDTEVVEVIDTVSNNGGQELPSTVASKDELAELEEVPVEIKKPKINKKRRKKKTI